MQVYLETERLVLRQFTPDDVDNLHALDSDAEVVRYVGGVSTPRDEIEREYIPAYLAYYARGDAYGFWAVEEKSSGAFLGWFHFRPNPDADTEDPELGYRLHKATWGKGYGTEGARALLHKGFTELGVQRVVASADIANTASWRVMEKVGMTRVRTFLYDPADPASTSVEYAVSKADWDRQQSTDR